MTIEKIILKEKEIAEEFQKIVDTHIVNEVMSLEELYCNDTEFINEELKRYKNMANYHNTIANTMNKYQKIQEIISKYGNVGTSFICIDKIREVIEDGND